MTEKINSKWFNTSMQILREPSRVQLKKLIRELGLHVDLRKSTLQMRFDALEMLKLSRDVETEIYKRNNPGLVLWTPDLLVEVEMKADPEEFEEEESAIIFTVDDHIPTAHNIRKLSQDQIKEIVQAASNITYNAVMFVEEKDGSGTRLATKDVSYTPQIIYDKLKQFEFPFTVAAYGHVIVRANPDAGTEGLMMAFIEQFGPGNVKVMREKVGVTIKNDQELRNYASTIISRIRGLLHPYGDKKTHEKTLNVVDFHVTTKQRKAKLVRVAKFEAENCVINILRGFLPNKTVDTVYDILPELKPDDDGHVYLNHEQLEKIARKLMINIITYTAFGARESIPWHSYGDKKKKKVHIKISCEHATIMHNKLKVSEIVYDDDLKLPDTVNVVDYDYLYYATQVTRYGRDEIEDVDPKDEQAVYRYFKRRDAVFSADGLVVDPVTVGKSRYHVRRVLKYYTIIDNGKLTIHKTFRPSSITGDPKDDENIDLAYMFTDEQLLYRLFKDEHKLQSIKNSTIRSITAAAEHFIGRRVLKPFDRSIYTEYDMNKCFMSYDKSDYYIGFPTNKQIPTLLENAKNPAFVVCSNILNPPASFRYFNNYEHGQIVLPYPVYRYLVDNENIEIDVEYVLESEFQHISIFDYADKRELVGKARKDFCNHIIGRTITGGVKELKTVKCYYTGEAEQQQIIHECQQSSYNFVVEDQFINIEIPGTAKGLFNFHSYILAYASIHMMTKWKQLEEEGHEIVAYNVDALVVKGDFEQNDTHVGGWKTSRPKEYYTFFQANPDITPTNVNLPQIRVPKRKLPTKHILIVGAAGLSKTYPYLNDPAFDQIITTPTHELKRSHKKYTDNVTTLAKYFQFTADDSVFRVLRASGKIPDEHTYVVIDEPFMANEHEWRKIMERCGNSIIIALGDPEQICNEIDSDAVTTKFFIDHGFDIVEFTRKPDAIARHEYDYGLKLDELRYKPIPDQINRLLRSFRDNFIQWDIRDADIEVDKVVVGSHKIAHKYNHEARKEAILRGCLFPFRSVGRDPKTVMLPVKTPNVYWDRQNMRDQAPKGTKYEPYFAVTSDSLQGKTLENMMLYVDIQAMDRHGSLYTAVTRTKTPENWRIIGKN